MRVLDATPVDISYGQIYVTSGDNTWTEQLNTIGGQRNGLCGAGWPGALLLITALSDGQVLFTVDVEDGVPPIDDSWEDIVEASFVPGTEAALIEMMGQAMWPIPLIPGVSYRVRYCASGMDDAREHQYDERDEGELVGDRYLLCFWPAPPEPDAVIRQTSEFAAFWHGVAAETRPPIPPEQIVEGERLAREVDDRLMKESALQSDWGDRPPTERQRQVLDSNILGMARLDRKLTDEISVAGPATQRAVARWAARRALEAAGLAQLPWVAPALRSLEAGSPLPPPFDVTDAQMRVDPGAAPDPAHDPFAWLKRDATVVYTTVAPVDGGPYRISQQHFALPALQSAAADDPLKAAIDALSHALASFGIHYPALLAQARIAFPVLG